MNTSDLSRVARALRELDPGRADHQAGVADLYHAFRLLLGRAPDEGGWAFWSARVASGMSLDELVRLFHESDEGRRRWAAPPVTVQTRRGFSIDVDPLDPSVSREIRDSGDYEPEVSDFLTQALPKARGAFLDIGANVGWYLLLAATIAPGTRLIGFEPNPGNVQLLLRNLSNCGRPDARLLPFAATSSETVLGLTFVGSNGAVMPAAAGAVLVKGVRADDYLAGEHIGLVKIDVEGHEPLALAGLDTTLRAHRPIIVSEFHPQALRQNAGVSGEEYLQKLVDRDYALGVIERGKRGEVTPCASIAAVMKAWEAQNARLKGHGEIHLDLVARPRNGSA